MKSSKKFFKVIPVSSKKINLDVDLCPTICRVDSLSFTIDYYMNNFDVKECYVQKL